ncbi:hypothetical protein, partial [Xanthomonas populi]|uniref:hypothetical protein n=1 Tax=Xanthomonas populi TaxID=53414 RepID=UPI001ABFB678
ADFLKVWSSSSACHHGYDLVVRGALNLIGRNSASLSLHIHRRSILTLRVVGLGDTAPSPASDAP